MRFESKPRTASILCLLCHMFDKVASVIIRPPRLCFQDLTTIVTYCLEQAERLQMRSLSFPAIGTGALCFPRDVVSRVLLRETRSFSRRRTPRHLRDVVIVVHPSDKLTVDVSQPGRHVTDANKCDHIWGELSLVETK